MAAVETNVSSQPETGVPDVTDVVPAQTGVTDVVPYAPAAASSQRANGIIGTMTMASGGGQL